MAIVVSNRVRELRERCGMSQVVLAAATGLSRQSIGAIESNRTLPGVDVGLRLAKALACSVEQLFGSLDVEPPVSTECAARDAPRAGTRVALSHLASRWVSHPLTGAAAGTGADGLLADSEKSARKHRNVRPLRNLAEARDNVLVMGCAGALGLLAERVNTHRAAGGGRMLWLPGSSTRALDCVAHHQIHIAGVHLVDSRTGIANVCDVRRHSGKLPVELITLARWEAGFVVAAGNPKNIRGAADLGQKGLKLVTREVGSGARRLFDQQVRQQGLTTHFKNLHAHKASGHFEVAHAISMAAADVGIATREAALAYGLTFIPLVEERYDIVIPLEYMHHTIILQLFDTMMSAPVRNELTALGYDTRLTGTRVTEMRAA